MKWMISRPPRGGNSHRGTGVPGGGSEPEADKGSGPAKEGKDSVSNLSRSWSGHQLPLPGLQPLQHQAKSFFSSFRETFQTPTTGQ